VTTAAAVWALASALASSDAIAAAVSILRNMVVLPVP
jgi:hypothetical protein